MSTSLIDTLHPTPDYRRTPLSLLRWWEARRRVYNKAVGSAGLVTLAGIFILHPARAELFAPVLLVAVAVYGLMANVCYCFGWAAELVARAVWGPEAPEMGPLLFREGLIFSVGLTLFPLFLGILLTIARLIAGMVGIL